MTAISLSSVINEKFINLFQSSGSASSSSGTISLSASSSNTSLSSTLRTGAQTFAASIQALNSSIGFLNTTKEDLKSLLEIADKLIDVAERASRRSTTTATRAELTAEYNKLGNAYHRVVDNAKIGDYEVLSEEDISAALQMVGLDKDASDAVAAIFKLFKLSDRDDILASDYTKGGRPVHVPASAYLKQVIVPGTAGNGDGTFNAPVSYSTLQGALGSSSELLCGDMDGDGKDDLVTHLGPFDGGTVEVLLSQGDGTFVSNGTYDGTMPANAALGDINGDSELDLVGFAASAGPVLFGNGDGSFGAVSSVSYDFGAANGTLIDIDQDGCLDAVTQNGTTVFVSLNNGNGSFAAPVSYDAGASSGALAGIAGADVNNDSHMDVVFLTQDAGGNGLRVLLGNGDGSLNAALSFYSPASSNPSTIRTGYLNEDGRIDLVVEDASNSLYVYMGNGNGGFASPVSYYTGQTDGTADVRVADLNGDNKQDLVSSTSVGRVEVLFGNGDGSFQTGITYAVSAGTGVSVIDSRGNDIPDIVTIGSGDGPPYYNSVSVFLGNGNASVPASTTTMFVPRQSLEYNDLFDKSRTLRNQVDGYYLLNDAKAFKDQIEKNMKAIDKALELVGQNIDLVRGVGFAFLDEASQLKGTEEAQAVASDLQKRIRENAPAALAQAENLNAIVVATLTIVNSGLSYKKDS